MRKYTFIIFIILTGELKSQLLHHQSMGAQGNFSFTENYKVLQTIGQMSPIGNYKTNSVIIQQGFQQSLYGIENNAWMSIVFNVYPNPARDFVIVSFDKNLNEPYTLLLSDISGRAISRWDNINTSSSEVSLKDLAAGTYVLSIEMGKRKFYKKILKINDK